MTVDVFKRALYRDYLLSFKNYMDADYETEEQENIACENLIDKEDRLIRSLSEICNIDYTMARNVVVFEKDKLKQILKIEKEI